MLSLLNASRCLIQYYCSTIYSIKCTSWFSILMEFSIQFFEQYGGPLMQYSQISCMRLLYVHYLFSSFFFFNGVYFKNYHFVVCLPSNKAFLFRCTYKLQRCTLSKTKRTSHCFTINNAVTICYAWHHYFLTDRSLWASITCFSFFFFHFPLHHSFFAFFFLFTHFMKASSISLPLSNGV